MRLPGMLTAARMTDSSEGTRASCREDNRMHRVLIVDDEADIRETLDMILRYEKYETLLARNGEEALALLEDPGADLALLDVKMPGMDGLEVLAAIRARHPAVAVLMISGHGTIATAVDALKAGAMDFLEKPLDRDRLLVRLKNASAMLRLNEENVALRGKVSERYRILGESAALKRILATIEKVAPTQARVLITGENGTGKELVARNIHERSARWKGPFVEVNCAAIPRELIESELFGHEKGSFTGATARRRGKFEQADGGTIFLDEIGDMDPAAQSKVLRVLEESTVERVGGEQLVSVDVRILAATNKDLREAVEKGEFREDLYYRLSVVPIHVPTLAERRDDIPLLARHFLAEAVRLNDLEPRSLTAEAEALLVRQPWPGNVRQLRNLMERVAILAPPGPIPPAAVEEHLAPRRRAAGDPVSECRTFEEFKDASEKLFLQTKLSENEWNIKRTAELLGMQRSHLYKKIERYGLK
jgi:two-component system nitrogen regulation response regulator NtrX